MAKTQAIILTTQRTGGTFLAFCLSNHQDIFCARGEPLAPRSFWADGAPDPVERLHILLHQQHYDVSMCKLVDTHAFDQPGVWRYVVENDTRVIWLKRQNILEQAVSHEINAARSRGEIDGHPTHAFQSVDPPPVVLDPEGVLRRCNDERARYRRIGRRLEHCGLPTLQIDYEQITDGGQEVDQIPERIARRICFFLGVEVDPLMARMNKVHKRALADTVSNWHEVVLKLRGTRWEEYL